MGDAEEGDTGMEGSAGAQEEKYGDTVSENDEEHPQATKEPVLSQFAIDASFVQLTINLTIEFEKVLTTTGKFMHLKVPNILKQRFPTFRTVITVADNK